MIIAIIFIFIFIFLQSKEIMYAKETNQSGIIVSATFNDDNQYNLSVVVHAGGAVIDGTQSIREGIVDYSLPLDTKKEFQILPDKGYKIKSVSYSRPELDDTIEDITQEVEGGMYSLDIESTQMKLEVIFVKKEGNTPPLEDNEKPPNDTSSTKPGNMDQNQSTNNGKGAQPNTGDRLNTSLMSDILLLIGTGVIVCLLLKKEKKGNDTQETYKR